MAAAHPPDANLRPYNGVMNRSGIVFAGSLLAGALIVAAWLLISWLVPAAPDVSPGASMPSGMGVAETASSSQNETTSAGPSGDEERLDNPPDALAPADLPQSDDAVGSSPESSGDPDIDTAIADAALNEDVRPIPPARGDTQTQRMMNVRDVITGCYSLLERLGGDWPADATAFAEVHAVGRVFDVIQGRADRSRDTATKLLALPTLVYRRPPHRMDDPEFDPQWVVFHEYIGNTFPPDGIAGGFADGHIEWITDEDAFAAMMNDADGG